MTAPKLIAGGIALALAAGAGAVVSHSLDSPAGGSAASSGTPAQTRNVSDDSTARQIYDGSKDSVAYVSSQMPEGEASGTGFVVSSDGLVVTNHHVIEGATQVAVVIGTGKQQLPAQVVADDPSKDLALLKVDTGGAKLETLPLGDSSKVGVGDATYAIGSPFGLDNTLTSGIVSALHRDIQAPDGATISDVIQTDAAINPGNSGGPLLDENGQVIGVNSQIATGSQDGSGGGNVGVGFSIPSNTVKDFLAKAKSGDLTPQQEQQPEQTDPFGDQVPVDPYGEEAPVDPYGDQQVDPYGLPQDSDPSGARIG
jgi:putative serine protease PepD